MSAIDKEFFGEAMDRIGSSIHDFGKLTPGQTGSVISVLATLLVVTSAKYERIELSDLALKETVKSVILTIHSELHKEK